jgi:hypothetical protein
MTLGDRWCRPAERVLRTITKLGQDVPSDGTSPTHSLVIVAEGRVKKRGSHGISALFPETALALHHALVYGMLCILAGASLIGLSVYIALLCSEMFFSQPPSKSPRVKVPQLAHSVLVAKEGLELPAVETRILVAPNREEVVRVTTPVHGGQIPMTAPATLESEPTWS